MNNGDSLTNKIIELKMQYKDLSIQHFMNYELFTWVWWFGIFCAIIPLILWWKVVDRKRILEITILGLVVNVSATILDVFGSEFALWEYIVRILPQIPLLFPVDYILLPIIEMLIYQRFPKWKGFIIANIFAAAILSFAVEPLATLIGQYRLISWKYVYSFPIYIIIAAFSKYVTERIVLHKTE